MEEGGGRTKAGGRTEAGMKGKDGRERGLSRKKRERDVVS